MGSEQSHQGNAQNRSNNGRLQRGHTIAITGRRLSSPNDETASNYAASESRPVSPPISVCSDSDLPYVSYTDKLGGKRASQAIPIKLFSFHLLTITNIFIHRLTKATKQIAFQWFEKCSSHCCKQTYNFIQIQSKISSTRYRCRTRSKQKRWHRIRSRHSTITGKQKLSIRLKTNPIQ